MSSLLPVDAAVCDTALSLTCDTLDRLRDVFTLRDVTFRRKADGSVVSATDQEIHDQLTCAIGATFPNHEVVSEEGLHTSQQSQFRWVIDPIDGTSNFTSGLPYWCVSVALTFNGQVVMGVIDAPELNRRFMGVAGKGTWVDDGRAKQRVRVREPVDVFDEHSRQIPVLLTPSTLPKARQQNVALRKRVLGSTALDLAFVADGTAAGSVAVVPHLWDVAAGVLLVHEAGGVVFTETDVLLPVDGARDYAQRQSAVVAGADTQTVSQLASLLLPPTRAEALSLVPFEL